MQKMAAIIPAAVFFGEGRCQNMRSTGGL